MPDPWIRLRVLIKGLVTLAYSSCASTTIVVEPIRFKDPFKIAFLMQTLIRIQGDKDWTTTGSCFTILNRFLAFSVDVGNVHKL